MLVYEDIISEGLTNHNQLVLNRVFSNEVKLTSSSEPETFGDFNQFQPAFINAHYLQDVLTY